MQQIRQRTQTNTRPYFTCGGLSSEEMRNLFILLCVAMICISATTITKTICQPAMPKVVRHKLFIDNIDGLDAYVTDCIKNGYIIKTVSLSQAGSNGLEYSAVVIAEKY